ncbi:hypothetical protein, partial [Acidocella aminolytica]
DALPVEEGGELVVALAHPDHERRAGSAPCRGGLSKGVKADFREHDAAILAILPIERQCSGMKCDDISTMIRHITVYCSL